MPTILRNLPLCETYALIASRHTGGLENAEVCSNCGRPIVEVATLRDSHANEHLVGMDCAATLTSHDPLTMLQHTAAFTEARAFSTRLRKSRKLDASIAVVLHEYGPNTGYYRQGGFSVQLGAGPNSPGYFWKNFPVELLAHIKPLTEHSTVGR